MQLKYTTLALALVTPCLHGQPLTESELDELVIVGSSTPINANKVGSAVSVLDAIDIESIGAPYVSDVLRHVPGLAVSRTGAGGGITAVRIRGAEANHVLVIVDGVEVNDANGDFDFSSLVTDNIERIEVPRGPQSGLYGSNATAGVINVVTKRGSKGFGGNVSLEAGTLDNTKAAINLYGGSDRLQGALNILHQQTEFDASRAGDEDDEDRNLTVTANGTALITENFTLGTVLRFVDKDSDVDDFDFSGGPLQGLAIDSDGFSDTKESNIEVNGTLRLLDNNLTTKIAYTLTSLDTEGSTFDTTANFGDDTRRKKLSLASTYDFARLGAFDQQLTLFAEREEEEFKNAFPSSPAQIPEQNRTLKAVGFEYRTDINETFFIGLTGRSDNNDKFDDVSTYSLTLAYLLGDDIRLHASTGNGVSNPTFFEQFGFSPDQFIGNPDLEPEESKGFDIGLEQKFFNGDLVVDITYFDSTLEDEISSGFNLIAGLPTSINSPNDSDRNGYEISATAILGSWNIGGNFTYTDAEENDLREVRRPQHIANLDLTYNFDRPNTRVSINAVYNGTMLDNDFRNFFNNNFTAERTRVDNYTLVNLSGSYQTDGGLQFYGNINNVFDEDYEEVISFDTPGIYATLGVRVPF